MAFADPMMVEIERKLDAGTPLSMDDGLALYRSVGMTSALYRYHYRRAPSGA